ncbi:MAG: prepilin-type N-terminal cleavage/methylation domain-containing protein [Candidatus Omnitrophica bacterium]|nr:prepilin-type N-terminal cleavage/methylation domain-containing protein [Candidatus Omnitrophota bacterium]
MNINKKSGFTLIEIIIVIIILGVLASLALPRMTMSLETAKLQEAFGVVSSIKSSFQTCYDQTQDATKCVTQSNLGISLPATADLKLFYTLTAPATATGTFTISAASKTAQKECLRVIIDPTTGGTTSQYETTAVSFKNPLSRAQYTAFDLMGANACPTANATPILAL